MIKNLPAYISGPITGNRFYEQIFDAAEKTLIKLGWSPELIINPVKLCQQVGVTHNYAACMAVCLDTMPSSHACLIQLPGWKDSGEALIEYELAKLRNYYVFSLVGSTLKAADELLQEEK